MTDEPNQLGEYLRARRALVSPESVGIPALSGRRVSGLRREEVALLAGISADYYLRLERGRDRHPSVQVLEAIGRVLQLDDAGLAYLLGLGGEKPRRARRRPRTEAVPVGIAKLIASLPFPAFVEGRYFDVLAANARASALSPRLVVGGNRLRDMFLDPGEQDFHPDWERSAALVVSGFRQSVGTDSSDPRFVELVGELSIASPQFRRLWDRQDVRPLEGAPMSVDHPQLGELRLNREKLAIGGTTGLTLVIYHPDQGSDDAEKLVALASVALPTRPSTVAP